MNIAIRRRGWLVGIIQCENRDDALNYLDDQKIDGYTGDELSREFVESLTETPENMNPYIQVYVTDSYHAKWPHISDYDATDLSNQEEILYGLLKQSHSLIIRVYPKDNGVVVMISKDGYSTAIHVPVGDQVNYSVYHHIIGSPAFSGIVADCLFGAIRNVDAGISFVTDMYTLAMKVMGKWSEWMSRDAFVELGSRFYEEWKRSMNKIG